MKKQIAIFGAMFICCLGTSLLVAASTDEIKKAISKGAKGKITFRVVDTQGNPVAGAQVGAGFFNQNMKGDGAGVSGKTDSNGLFTATGEPTGDMHYLIKSSMAAPAPFCNGSGLPMAVFPADLVAAAALVIISNFPFPTLWASSRIYERS
jgi:hypothetical protein